MRNLHDVDLNLLVALDVLLDEHSVRGAARRLNVTPSAMSHTLQRLRALLGDELLVRAGRQMIPTSRAERLVQPVRDMLAQARIVLAEPAPFSAATSRRAFRVACTDHISTVLLPAVEAILADEAPDVALFVHPAPSRDAEQLRTGSVDLAIGVHAAAPPDVRRQPLFDDRYVTVARRDHPRIRGKKLTLKTYLSENHVLVAPGGSPTGPIDELLTSMGHQRRVARTRPNFLAALWLVAESDALLTVSERIVIATAARLPVKMLPPPLPVARYQLSMSWHARLDAAAEDAWFRDVMIRAAAVICGGSGADGG